MRMQLPWETSLYTMSNWHQKSPPQNTVCTCWRHFDRSRAEMCLGGMAFQLPCLSKGRQNQRDMSELWSCLSRGRQNQRDNLKAPKVPEWGRCFPRGMVFQLPCPSRGRQNQRDTPELWSCLPRGRQNQLDNLKAPKVLEWGRCFPRGMEGGRTCWQQDRQTRWGKTWRQLNLPWTRTTQIM